MLLQQVHATISEAHPNKYLSLNIFPQNSESSAQPVRSLGSAIVSSILHSTGRLEKKGMMHYGKSGSGTVKVYTGLSPIGSWVPDGGAVLERLAGVT